MQKMKVHTPTNEHVEERHRTGAASPEENFVSTAAKRVSAKTAVDLRCVFTAAERISAKTAATSRRSALTAAKRISAKTAVEHRCVLTAA